jgi:hypothetical protein
MGEANLMLSRHILLPGVPVRYPNLWPVSAQYAFGHGFVAHSDVSGQAFR